MFHSEPGHRYGNRAKGMKVKHLVQLVAVTVVFTWLLYQVKSLHRAKVIARRADKAADDLDDPLLITAGDLKIGKAADKVVYRKAEVADDNLIDLQPEFESSDPKNDFEDLADRREHEGEDDFSKDGDDESANVEQDKIRGSEETDIETQGDTDDVMEERYFSTEHSIEKVPDGDDLEDEVQGSAENEFDDREKKSETFPEILTEDEILEKKKALAGYNASALSEIDEWEDLRPDGLEDLQDSKEAKGDNSVENMSEETEADAGGFENVQESNEADKENPIENSSKESESDVGGFKNVQEIKEAEIDNPGGNVSNATESDESDHDETVLPLTEQLEVTEVNSTTLEEESDDGALDENLTSITNYSTELEANSTKFEQDSNDGYQDQHSIAFADESVKKEADSTELDQFEFKDISNFTERERWQNQSSQGLSATPSSSLKNESSFATKDSDNSSSAEPKSSQETEDDDVLIKESVDDHVDDQKVRSADGGDLSTKDALEELNHEATSVDDKTLTSEQVEELNLEVSSSDGKPLTFDQVEERASDLPTDGQEESHQETNIDLPSETLQEQLDRTSV